MDGHRFALLSSLKKEKPRIARACPELAEGLPGFFPINLCDLRVSAVFSVNSLLFSLLAILLFASCQSQPAELPEPAPTEAFQEEESTPPQRPTEKDDEEVTRAGEQSGSTYYVATNGADATGDGSDANPWRTIQFAVDQVAPGDTILVRSGTYAGFRIEKSGAAEAWITLKAAPGAEVLINKPGPNNKHDSNIEVETWEGDGVVAYWIIEGFEVANAPNWGIDLRGNDQNHSHHIIVRGNTVHHNGVASGKSGIFTAFVDDVLIENNESYANGEHGIYHSNSGDNPVIRGNVLHHNPNCGIHMNGDLSQGGDGIISNGLVEKNVIYENGTGGCSGINLDGVTGTLVRNNLLYQNHAGGISLFQENGAVCSQNNRILNNTLVMADDGRWAINISHATCVDNKLFNNIIYTHHSWRGSIVIPTASLAGFESDYNVVMDRFSADDDNSVISLAEWQALGYDRNSRIAAPNDLFANPAGNDYHLKTGSPAIDTGVTLPNVPDDLAGNPRPWGAAFDIGALEYTSGTPAATPAATPRATPPRAPTVIATTPSDRRGHITYSLPNGRVYRIPAQPGATPEDVSLGLDQLAPGSEDEGLNISPDGAWLVLDTDRFDPDCAGWPCLTIVKGDLSAGEAVRAGGELIHPEGFSAVASGGDLIVYPAGDGPHTLDLWAVARDGNAWGPPVLLTSDSPYDWHEYPAISADGSKVVFTCGPTPYGGAGTALCEVNTDGTGWRVVLTPADSPPGFPDVGALHHPDYAPDGSIIFEGDWGGEQIWRLPAGATEPIRVAPQFGNDNSPCVLPDGRIVSLWLERSGGPGTHELKLMAADGSRHVMLLTGMDVFDIGTGCGE